MRSLSAESWTSCVVWHVHCQEDRFVAYVGNPRRVEEIETPEKGFLSSKELNDLSNVVRYKLNHNISQILQLTVYKHHVLTNMYSHALLSKVSLGLLVREQKSASGLHAIGS